MKTIKTLSVLLSLSLVLSGPPAFTLESATLDHAVKMSAGGLDKGYENSRFSKGEATVGAPAANFSKPEGSALQKAKTSSTSLSVSAVPKASKKSSTGANNGSTANFYFWAPVFIGACAGGALGPIGVLAGAAIGAAIGWSLTR